MAFTELLDLEKAGFTRSQVEGLARLLDKQLASKDDLRVGLAELRQEMAGLRGDLRQEMADLKVELRHEIADLKLELRQEMGRFKTDLRQEMASFKIDTIKWVAGIALGQTALIVGLIKLLP